MVEIDIPGHKALRLSHLVLDFNGTIACDGRLIDGVRERLDLLARHLHPHVLTADTFGSVREQLTRISCTLSVIPEGDQAHAKASYVRQLGAQECVSIGNGRNDALMLRDAALGIAVAQTEGASVEAIVSADVVTTHINDALDLLLNPLRLTATLRS